MNVNTKKLVWDAVPKSEFKLILVRIFCVILSFYLTIQAYKALSLVEIALVLNTAPLFVGIMSYFVFKEKIRIFDLVCLLISFIGFIVLIVSDEQLDE